MQYPLIQRCQVYWVSSKGLFKTLPQILEIKIRLFNETLIQKCLIKTLSKRQTTHKNRFYVNKELFFKIRIKFEQ